MPIEISADLPDPGPYDQITIPAAAWDQLIGVARTYGWDSAKCPRGFEISRLDAEEADELIDIYDEARAEQWDYYAGGSTSGRPPEWAVDLPHPDELRDLADEGGLRIAPSS
jgi:hypothetical protein